MNFKSLLFSLGLLLAIGASQQARADIVNFEVSGVFPIAGTYSGTLSIDTTLGAVSAADITLSGFHFDGEVFQISEYQAIPATYVVQILDADGALLQLAFTKPGATPGSLLGFTGGSIFSETVRGPCPLGYGCDDIDSVHLVVVSNGERVITGSVGTVAAIAAVPELSTWAMMILGFAGCGLMAFRRRKVTALAA